MRSLLYGLIAVAFALGFLMGYNYRGSRAQVTEVAAPKPAAATAPRLSIPAGQAVVGFLDTTDGRAVIAAAAGSEVKISGWAGCSNSTASITKVEVLVDDRTQGEATLSFPRPDVGAAYGRPDFDRSGWKAVFASEGIQRGRHRLSARVACSNGETGNLPAFQLAVN